MIIVEILFIIFFSFIAILNYHKDKRWYQPNVFIPMAYSLILLLAMLQLYGLYEGTPTAIACILIGVFGFLIGAAVSERFRIKRKQKIIVEPKNIDKLLFIILIVCFFSSVVIGIQNIIAGVGLSEIRTEYFSSEGGNNQIQSILKEYLLAPLPILYLSIVFSKAMNRKIKKWHILTGILVVLSNIVISASRKSLIVLIAFILVYLSEKKLHLTPMVRRLSFFGALVLVVTVIGISINRGSSGIIREAYNSLSGCVPLLGQYIKFQGTDITHTICFSAYHGVFSFPLLILNYVGIMGYPELYLQSSKYLNTQTYLPVSSSHRMCAFVTPFYDFYIDGGYITVFLGMLLFGMICQSVYRDMMTNRNMRNTAVFSVLMYGLVSPYGHFIFCNSKYLFVIILLYVIYRAKVVRTERQP